MSNPIPCFTKPLPCFCCGRDFAPAFEPDPDLTPDYPLTPSEGTTFTARGNYGSTVFDSIDESFLELNLCDACLLGRRDKIVLRRRTGPTWIPPLTTEPWEPYVVGE